MTPQCRTAAVGLALMAFVGQINAAALRSDPYVDGGVEQDGDEHPPYPSSPVRYTKYNSLRAPQYAKAQPDLSTSIKSFQSEFAELEAQAAKNDATIKALLNGVLDVTSTHNHPSTPVPGALPAEYLEDISHEAYAGSDSEHAEQPKKTYASGDVMLGDAPAAPGFGDMKKFYIVKGRPMRINDKVSQDTTQTTQVAGSAPVEADQATKTEVVQNTGVSASETTNVTTSETGISTEKPLVLGSAVPEGLLSPANQTVDPTSTATTEAPTPASSANGTVPVPTNGTTVATRSLDPLDFGRSDNISEEASKDGYPKANQTSLERSTEELTHTLAAATEAPVVITTEASGTSQTTTESAPARSDVADGEEQAVKSVSATVGGEEDQSAPEVGNGVSKNATETTTTTTEGTVSTAESERQDADGEPEDAAKTTSPETPSNVSDEMKESGENATVVSPSSHDSAEVTTETPRDDASEDGTTTSTTPMSLKDMQEEVSHELFGGLGGSSEEQSHNEIQAAPPAHKTVVVSVPDQVTTEIAREDEDAVTISTTTVTTTATVTEGSVNVTTEAARDDEDEADAWKASPSASNSTEPTTKGDKEITTEGTPSDVTTEVARSETGTAGDEVTTMSLKDMQEEISHNLFGGLGSSEEDAENYANATTVANVIADEVAVNSSPNQTIARSDAPEQKPEKETVDQETTTATATKVEDSLTTTQATSTSTEAAARSDDAAKADNGTVTTTSSDGLTQSSTDGVRVHDYQNQTAMDDGQSAGSESSSTGAQGEEHGKTDDIEAAVTVSVSASISDDQTAEDAEAATSSSTSDSTTVTKAAQNDSPSSTVPSVPAESARLDGNEELTTTETWNEVAPEDQAEVSSESVGTTDVTTEASTTESS